MNILVINCGSSSLSFKVYEHTGDENDRVVCAGKASNVATRTQAVPVIEWSVNGEDHSRNCEMPIHRAAAHHMLVVLEQLAIRVDAIGHRFVHGGDVFDATTRIDERSLPGLRACLPLAPIHNPNSYSVIETCLERLPGIAQFAVFDTAFHSSLPQASRTYALPNELAQRYGLRKYGFHGLSYQYVSQRAAGLLEKPIDTIKLIMCHLGTGGSSVCAFADGHSVETSMGFSPLAGLVMSTRCGDIDAEVALELVRRGMTADEVSRLLNHESGLIGLSAYSSNLAEIIESAEAGNERCRLAYDVYANRLQHYLGAYTWQLGGADAIVFTDDIGTRSWKLREKVLRRASGLGVQLDINTNRSAPADRVSQLHLPGSPTKVLVIPTDEEQVIYTEVIDSLRVSQ
ncbi:MAG TPA: acetate/propionate family kinase [Anaerolineaceae bacterium]|nr:acetate/propionate family kinase [Anaerolineaceae bacterium]